ncbi:MAG: hypothetical protein ACR2GX_03390 [Candidatus Dormibacteria bacterium]
MFVVLRIVCIALLLWCLTGLAVWVWLPSRWRPTFLPALPILGVMAIAVGLHLSGLALGVGTGIWVLISISVAAIAWRTRMTDWWHDLADWRWLLAGTFAGLAVALLLLSPTAAIGAQMIEPGGSSDGYAYATSAQWLEEHSLLDPPAENAAPAWAYPRDVYAIGLRLGQDVNQAAVAKLSDVDTKDSWYIVMSLWLVLVPGALVVAARLLRLASVIGFVAGAATCVSGVVLGQALFSFAACLLGIAMTPLSLALVARHLQDGRRHSDAPMPVWLPALGAAALVCTYTEALWIFLPGIAGYALHLARGQVVAVLRGAVQLAVAVVVVVPLGTYRAARSLATALGGLSPGDALAPFLGVPTRVIASHLTGTRSILDPSGTRWAYLGLGFLAIGLLAAVVLSSARHFFAWHLGSIAVVVGLLSTVRYAPYGQGRAVSVAMSTLLLGVVSGWAALWGDIAQRFSTPWPKRALRTVAVGALMAFVGVNVQSTLPYLATGPGHYRNQLLYTPEFDSAGTWLQRVAGPDGGSAMVVETRFHEQLWLRYRLRDLPAVQYPYLPQIYSDRTADVATSTNARYVVAQRQAWLVADPSVLVSQDAQFRHLDLGAGSVMLAAGGGGFHPIDDDGSGHPVQWMGDDGDLLIVHSPTIRQISVRFNLPPGQQPLSLNVVATGLPDQRVVASAGSTVTLSLPTDRVAFLRFHNERPAAMVPQLPWPASLAIMDVS